MVAVPELVLYRVCRLYFSTLLPFTTKLKSGIINLRAAREAPVSSVDTTICLASLETRHLAPRSCICPRT